jgi:DNA-binding transcriptional ArsR family regulator
MAIWRKSPSWTGLLLLSLLFVGVSGCIHLGKAPLPSPEVDTEFAAPAQMQGNLSVHGAWALIVFRQTQDTSFQLVLDAGAQQTNTTIFEEKPAGHGAPYKGGRWPIPLAPQTKTLSGGVAGTLRVPPATWASLFIAADSVSISGSNVSGDWRPHARGDMVEKQLPPVDFPSDTYNSFLPDPSFRLDGDGVTTALQGNQPSFPLSISATGIHHLEWHNATISCSSVSCPDSGQPMSTSINTTWGNWVQRLSYIHLAATGGALQGSGQVYLAASGAASLDAALSGTLRLPEAHLRGDCPHGPCPDAAGKTFLAQGTLNLTGIAREETEGRLHAHLSGHFTSAFFDEAPRPDFVVVAVGAAGLAVGLGVILWLFARSARPPVLQNPSRKRLYDVIRSNPGFSATELGRELAWSDGRLYFHLRRLKEAGLIVSKEDRNMVRFFENHGKYDDSWRHLAPLREDDSRRLHDWILKTPGLDQTRIAQATSAWGWTRARTLRRLARLEESGLVSATRDGRRLVYTALPAEVGSNSAN